MSIPFPTHAIVSQARKKDDRTDAAMRLCTPLPSGERGEGTAAVAVDGDRGSQYALKWAADHILSRTSSFFLLHVRRKHTSLHGGGKQFSISHVQDDVASAFHAQVDLHTKELLLPFQCFCSRRGLQCREIILDGADVSKAIVDFVASKNIDKLVLGSASRNAFTRTIRKLDTPTSVTKSAPNFCSVYVIAKGKLSSFRPATQANVNDTSKEASDLPGNRVPGVKSEPTPKLHNEGDNPSMSYESTEDGSLTSASSYLKTGSSWPSEFSETDRHSSYFSPEYLEYNRDRLLLPNKGNEQALISPNGKYLGYDESSFNDSALSPGYNICDPLSPNASGECTESTSSSAAYDLQEDDEAELTLFKIEQRQNKGGMLPSSYGEEHKEMARSPETYSSNLPPYRNRPEVESCSRSAIDRKHKPLSLDTSSSDSQCSETIIEEFTDHSSQSTVHPILRRLPPKFYSPRNDGRRESAPEETYILDLKIKALPRPIETKRMLECLPTRLECRTYTPQDIAEATDRFAPELKIGEGGYGPVYKATLDNTLVAIKILHSNVTQGLKQFRQEEGTFEELLDSNVTGWPVQEAREFAELALKCCEMRRRDRPDLESEVFPELVRLHKIVTLSSEGSSPHPSMDQIHQRSASEKDLPLEDDLADILNDRIVKGASFAI
ncbi:hypothetical protein EJB05_25257, partial [Eragrostis curvula]